MNRHRGPRATGRKLFVGGCDWRGVMLICKACGRRIEAVEIKFRVTDAGESKTICPDCAKARGI